MKFDKKVMESGVVVAFSLALAFTAAPVANVSTEAYVDSRTVELIAETAGKDFENVIATKVKNENDVVTAFMAEAQMGESAEETAQENLFKNIEEEASSEKTKKEEVQKEEKESGSAKKEEEQKEEKKSESKEAKEEKKSGSKEAKEEKKSGSKEAKEEKKSESKEAQEEKKSESAEKKQEQDDKEDKNESEDKSAEEKSEKASSWDSKLMAEVDEYLNVRSEASEEAELVGKLPKGAEAKILEEGEEWTKISSGSVEGYVKNEFCVTGKKAKKLAKELGTTYATATAGGLRVREEASAEEGIKILDVLEEGGKIEVDTEAEDIEGWVCVKVDDAVGYVSEEYVDVKLELGKAISIEEEQAAIAAAEAERKAQEAAQSSGTQQQSSGTQQKAAVAASYDDVTLLGALIQCEAGSECYEGQLAVGAVVMNRLRAGFAGSVSGVIYQSGQFTPASNGTLASVLASGVSGSCLQAAQQALAGADNVNGALSFRNVASGMSGIVIGNHVFF